jgi:hypothetical protein
MSLAGFRWIPVALLLLAVALSGCVNYATPDPACSGKNCEAECASDPDCAAGRECVFYEDGCCSQCQPIVCQTDADCSACEVCEPLTGECLATPCANGCGADADCAPDERCEFDAQGCCGSCQWFDRCAGLDCVATCVMDADCAPGDFCQVYEDGCCSMCLPAGDEVLLVPACVHAPRVVQAGGEFPLAVFGPIGCAWFDRVDVAAVGFDIQVRLIGLASPDPDCPQLTGCAYEDWAYMGLVWLPAPDPGGYRVTVSDSVTVTVGASGGIIEEPACQDDCPPPDLSARPWSLVSRSEAPLSASCGGFRNDGRPVQFQGQCQDYTVQAEYWRYPTDVHHCTDDWLYFGMGPFFQAEASVCHSSDASAPPRLLGIGWLAESGEQRPEAFLIESR